ncbi:LCP family protein [[Clostridium] symbiosum]|uniref:LCP family protein n=1 Tax=Clostridium symbiosum TaxID=1512 RepID=UPI001D08E359|nr:LCP family protein [[Clostridium] symbiosum]MCB6607751.1 LCP family protein [[Clostridium] symbiosum]MCB6932612.1 LCP family protein [[Clostridium] symbiosum]
MGEGKEKEGKVKERKEKYKKVMDGETGRENRNRWKKLLPFILAAGALVLLWFLWFSLDLYRQRQETEARIRERGNGEAIEVLGSAVENVLEYEGKKYRRNTAIRAILCIGVDTTGEMERYHVSGAAGQADGIFLVAQDMASDTVQILMIPRDTMTKITLFDYFGNELGKDVQHLTLAYAYGDGKEQSCELMTEAVSDLLYGLRVDGYFATNISTVEILNDEIGGVEILVEDGSLSEKYPEFVKGEKVLLKGKQAEHYIRYRDINQYQTALTRLERQKGYIKAYIETAKRRAEEDAQMIVRLMDDVEKYMITNMAKDQYMDMGLAVLNSPQIMDDGDFIFLPGEAARTELYEEFHPDEEKVKELVIRLFYKEVRS